MVAFHSTGRVVFCRHTTWRADVRRLLDRAFPTDRVADRPVLIKPNLVEAIPPPVTTPVELVAAIATELCQRLPDNRIIIGEGCAAREYDTFHAFEQLGYTEVARRLDVELLDLNEEEIVCRELAAGRVWRQIYLPAIVFESFLVSVPVLKAHSLAGVTLTMKNMMGCAPPSRYQRGGHWKKSAFHENMQEAVFDLNCCRHPDFTILDATVGMRVAHLWGPTCDPPPGLVAAAADPVAIDVWGCGVLGRDWRRIGHIAMANGVLGRADLAACEVTDG